MQMLDRIGEIGPAPTPLVYMVILHVLLYTSQVYEYIHHTEVTNMLLWLMFLLWLPVLTHFLLVLVLFQPVAVCVPAKVQLPILGN